MPEHSASVEGMRGSHRPVPRFSHSLPAMQYRNVCLEALAYTLPDEIVSSTEIETRLAPLYTRLRLPEGRLELMTGIAQRRFWPQGLLPSHASALTAQKAIGAAGIDRQLIGALVHGSVCRDHLEPATACAVHQRLGLSGDCLLYDVSNACLGLLNGVVQVANMIELGQIRAGLVVGTESSRALVENTIRRLNADSSLTRSDVKLAVASLTIGSGSAAILLVDRALSRTGNSLLGGVVRSDTQFSKLCQSAPDETLAGDSTGPLMWTDSESLMHEGIRVAKEAFSQFLGQFDWEPDSLQKVFCHQVGRIHRKMLFEALGLDPGATSPPSSSSATPARWRCPSPPPWESNATTWPRAIASPSWASARASM